MRRLPSRLLPAALALGALLVSAPGRADTRSDARAKLVQGGEALKRGEFEDALNRFQEAYRLVPSPKIQYNFGLAYRGLGRKAEAFEAFERFLAEAPDASKETRQNATRERAQLAGQITTLEVKVDLAGAEIFVDGRSYGVQRTAPIYLDPGPHQLMVEKAGEGPAYTERINASAGQRITVMARLIHGPVTQPPPPRDPPLARPVETAPRTPDRLPPPAPRAAPRWQPVVGWAAAAGAAGALALGVAELVSANSKFDDFNHRMACGENIEGRGSVACSTLYDDASSARRLSIVGFSAAGVLAATSVVFFVLTPPEGGESVSLACGPAGLAGVSCAGRF
jgi:hypothetical protein